MTKLPARLAYRLTIAYGRTCEISQFEYAELADARAMFESFANDCWTMAATLCGPEDEVIAEYEMGDR